MARFNDLAEQDRIQYIKDAFILILEQLAKDPNKLNDYIKLEKSKATVVLPAFSDAHKQSMSDAEKKQYNLAVKEIEAENIKLEAEFKTKEATYNKIKEIVSKLQKKEGCMCGTCMNISITNGMIAPELDILIEVARKTAEERAY